MSLSQSTDEEEEEGRAVLQSRGPPHNEDDEEEEEELIAPLLNPFQSQEEDSDEASFVPRLTGFTIEPDGVTYYHIQVTAENLGGKTWLIKKRYSQFDELRHSLKVLLFNPPKLPRKTFFHSTNKGFLRDRARGLSTFLWTLAGTPLLSRSTQVRNFFGSNVEPQLPRNLEPTTPLLNSTTSASQRLAYRSSFSLATLTSPVTTMSDEVTLTKEEDGDDDGRWVMTHRSAQDLQRGFASEGLTFSESDLEPEKEEESCWLSCQSVFGHPKVRPSLAAPTEILTKTGSLESLSFTQATERVHPTPKLRIVILLVGSRGDVQPYVALGKGLKSKGHTVRIAAHNCFRSWVSKDHGLDFAPVAGDPKELLRMVVEHKMFSYEFVKNGMTNHRGWVSQVLIDCWNACTQQDPDHPSNPVSSDSRIGPGIAFTALKSKFRADLIIANPPSFAGWHCAEALGVPLLMTFPMPWSRTVEFPSPFTSLSAMTSPANLNWLSYGAVDRLIWLGLGDLVNRFRHESLRLNPIWTMSAKGHRYIHDYRIPFLYCWSPSVLAKPKDWKDHILISGYMFLDDSDGSSWQPDQVLLDCFSSSTERKKVVFIGFGSIVVKDPARLSNIVSDTAIQLIELGFNVLVQKGWAGVDLPTNVPGLYSIGPAPHSWIFKRCSVVVHHGGSGTTAEGLKNGIPTVVVPFFGDQFFWGETVKRRGLGETEPYSTLTTNRLVECIINCCDSTIKENCMKVSKGIELEDGIGTAINFIENQVFPFDFSPEDKEWLKWPFYDLKKRVKLERSQDIKGMRKIKSRLKTFIGSNPSSATKNKNGNNEVATGLELKQLHCKTHPYLDDHDMPFLPKMYPGRVPDGHTPFSWFGNFSQSEVPVGHTNFSWKASTW